MQQIHLPRPDEARFHGVPQKLQQPVVVTGHVQQAQGFLVVTQLPPGPHFKQFFKRADAARQRQERIGPLRHQRLAFVHVGHHVQLGASVVGALFVHQRLWHHAHHGAPCCQGGVGHGTHQAVVATAVHQRTAVLTDPGADLGGHLGEQGVAAGA